MAYRFEYTCKAKSCTYRDERYRTDVYIGNKTLTMKSVFPGREE